MPWAYIYKLLGPGLHWNKTQEHFRKAVEKAEKDGQQEAAEHIKIIWRMRNEVMMESEEKDPGSRPG